MADPAALQLPGDFLMGVATAAYQIEGAADEDGRGVSVWDTFCAEPGRVADGADGSVACDHYHRYRDDVALMADLGVGAYRFSIAWPRVQPTGSGAINPAGLAFYDRLVDALLEHGIAPAATLFHWDLPQPLEDAGGWLERETALRFADYASVVAERLGDRVRMWMTVNEPSVVTMLGYAVGVHAPGRMLLLDALPAAHHLLLGHGLAVQALRTAGVSGTVGLANSHTVVWPLTDSADDQGAAMLYDGLQNRLFADPVLLGRMPQLATPMADMFTQLLPGMVDDLPTIHQPLDFYGVNYYNPMRVGAPREDAAPTTPDGALPADLPVASLPFTFGEFPEYPHTAFGWPVVPDALRELLVSMKARYGTALPPVYITENGASYADEVADDGGVHDRDRITFLDAHLRAVLAARDQGADVRGFFVWSLMDNFEWAEGYRQRFGLVHIDYATQKRTPKDSFGWLREVLAAR